MTENCFISLEQLYETRITGYKDMDQDQKKLAVHEYYAQIEEEDRIAEETEKKKEIESWRQEGLLYAKYRTCTFNNDDHSNPQFTSVCKKYVANIDEMKKANAGIIFCGSVGIGKTFQLSCMANALCDKGEKILMGTIDDIISRLLNKEPWAFNYAKNCPILILDDFGLERITDFTTDKMFELLDSRCNSINSVTIMSTNLEASVFVQSHNDIKLERIYSRICQLCPIMKTVKGSDRRRKSNSEIEKLKGLLK